MKDKIEERIAALPPDKRALFERRMKKLAEAAPSRAPVNGGVTPPSANSAARPQPPAFEGAGGSDKELDFSLFFFSDDGATSKPNKYHLLRECAKYADEHGFAAIWTPERHFKPFGGLYPNPAIITAALAAITSRLRLRAGSVVLPLQNPLRVAEEWATVDNLSNGRVGVAFASGWLADDFVLAPERYETRKELMFRDIELIKRLWQGESIRLKNGKGVEVDVRVYPNPLQPELPVWITATHEQTFVEAGRLGAGILTGLMEQSLEQCGERIRAYRRSLAANGHDPRAGRVAVMLHTFVGSDLQEVRELTRGPFCEYLRSFLQMTRTKPASGAQAEGDGFDLSEQDEGTFLDIAYERYFRTSALFGTPESCRQMVGALKTIDADEVACLLDFGLAHDTILNGLAHLHELQEATRGARAKHSSAVALPTA